MSTVNLEIAGMDPRTEQMFTRAQYDHTIRSEAIPAAANVPGNTEIVVRRAAVAGDPGACAKMIKLAHRDAPHGLEKSEPVVVEDKPELVHRLEGTSEEVTGPRDVTALIKS